MLHVIRDINDQLITLIKDDPVRPEIPAQDRVNDNSRIFVLTDEETNQPVAVTCVKFLKDIPESVDDLVNTVRMDKTAVFYTIWSYVPGAGTDLLMQTVEQIQQMYPTIERFVTLSPKTEMARKFHLRNGAEIFRENETTVNYEYRRV